MAYRDNLQAAKKSAIFKATQPLPINLSEWNPSSPTRTCLPHSRLTPTPDSHPETASPPAPPEIHLLSMTTMAEAPNRAPEKASRKAPLPLVHNRSTFISFSGATRTSSPTAPRSKMNRQAPDRFTATKSCTREDLQAPPWFREHPSKKLLSTSQETGWSSHYLMMPKWIRARTKLAAEDKVRSSQLRPTWMTTITSQGRKLPCLSSESSPTIDWRCCDSSWANRLWPVHLSIAAALWSLRPEILKNIPLECSI